MQLVLDEIATKGKLKFDIEKLIRRYDNEITEFLRSEESLFERFERQYKKLMRSFL